MEIVQNRDITEKVGYDDFIFHQRTIKFEVGDTIEILVNGNKVASHTFNFDTREANISIQDKSLKKTLTELEKAQYQLAVAQKNLADLGG